MSGTLFFRTPCTDGLGRISQATDATGTTTYGHDALNNLISVSQGSQTRSFNYDSLSRLTGATNPESGTTSYTYDANGNVLTRTDARGVTTSYNCFGSSPIDALNRVTCKSYSDGVTPKYQYQYDLQSVWGITVSNPIGHLSVAYAWPSTNIYNSFSASAPYSIETFEGFDPMGRPQFTYQWGPSTTYSPQAYFSFMNYNLVGDLLSFNTNITWLNGRVTYYSYDSANHLNWVGSSLSDSNHPGTLLSNFSYSAVGLTGVTLGNGVAETRGYNNRTWPTSVSSSRYTLSLSYYGNGDLNTSSDSANGNWTYTYDSANRLYQAHTTDGSGKSLTYGYDQYGNATCTAGSQNVVCNALSFNTANNRLSGYSYDAAGNLLSDGNCSYTYDGEERISTATCLGTTTTYIYDAEGKRIAKAVGNSVTEEYVYNPAGQLVSAYGPYPNSTWLRDEIYAGGRHIGTYTNGTTYFTHADWLGTERARTDVNGNLCGTATSQPFGDNASSWGCFTLSHNFFTGQESDPETSLHYFHARFDNNRFYRFQTPDPDNAGANLADPQSWNMYAYTRNNPTTLTDPSGLAPATGAIMAGQESDIDASYNSVWSNGGGPGHAVESEYSYEEYKAVAGSHNSTPVQQLSILGQKVGVTYHGLSDAQKQAASDKLQAAVDVINNADLTEDEKGDIHKITSISVSAGEGLKDPRTGSDPSGNENFRFSYLSDAGSTPAWTASAYAHDAYHLVLDPKGTIYGPKTAAGLEKKCNEFQMQVGAKFGLIKDQLDWIKNDTHTLYNTNPY